MGKYTENGLLRDTWIIYLRKSRQDDPNETVEEVLAKHETMLQEYAERELGRRIPEENIYREIVSGESIDERVEIKKVLARIEDPRVAGVLVVEPQRLSRGDLEDCGRLINTLRFTHTHVATPMMTYDLEKKMERKFFQDELLRGREYLEYTKEILFRGRVAAVKRGCYLGNTPPYGYKKVKIGKDHTLEIIEEQAEIVRFIFDKFINDRLTPLQIATKLNEMEVKAPRGKKWVKDSIRCIVRNIHYTGKVAFNKKKNTQVLDNGNIVTKRLSQPEDEIIIAEGKHHAIITQDTWEKAKAIVGSNPRVKSNHEMKSPLCSLLFCSQCGRAMYIHPYKKANDRYECATRPRCYKSVMVPDLLDRVVQTLESSELPMIKKKVENGDGQARKIQERLLAKLEKQMEEYREQEERQFDLLETGKYTQERFDQRNAILREKMEECQANIYKAKSSLPQNINYEEFLVKLEDAIAGLRDNSLTPKEQNDRLRSVVKRIEFKGQDSYYTDKKRDIGINKFSVSIFLNI